METVTLALTGKSLGDLAAQAIAFGTTAQEGVRIGKATATTKKTKKAAAATEEDEVDELEETEEIDADDLGEDTLEASSDEESFDDLDEDEEEVTTKKSAKGKTAKVTEKDVNAAAKIHAKKHTRPETLKILAKKFKVKSISELKPDQYAAAVAALKA